MVPGFRSPFLPDMPSSMSELVKREDRRHRVAERCYSELFGPASEAGIRCNFQSASPRSSSLRLRIAILPRIGTLRVSYNLVLDLAEPEGIGPAFVFAIDCNTQSRVMAKDDPRLPLAIRPRSAADATRCEISCANVTAWAPTAPTTSWCATLRQHNARSRVRPFS